MATWRASVLLSATAAIAGCGQLIGVDDVEFGAVAADACDPSTRSCEPNFVVETQNMFLYGRYEPYRNERRPYVEAAIRASTADVLCFDEIGHPGDREAIAEAVSGAYPHAYFAHTDESTPIDVPEDLFGNPPAPPGPPLCLGLDAQVDASLDCLAQHCSSIPGSGAGLFTDDECAVTNCSETILSLSTRTERLCAQCIHAVMDDHSIDEARRGCSVPPGDKRLGYSGDNASMVLSKHPIVRRSVFVLPSTASRQVVLRATVQKPGLPPVDVYCARFTSNKEGAYDYYVGPYGGGATGLKTWDNEVLLQAKRTSEWILAARPNRAVLMGWLSASREVTIGTELWVGGFREDALQVFEQGFTDAVPRDYPACTACLANPLFDDTFVDRRTDHVFLLGMNRDNVTGVSITNQEPVVPVEAGPRSKGKSIVPISDHYGLRVGLRVPR